MSFHAFVRDNVRWLAGGFMLTFFSSFGQTFFIALSAGSIRSEFHLSHGEFGTLYMVATLASALALSQLGRIVDYLSVSRVVLITIPLLALASIGMAYASNLAMLVIVIFGLRLFGQGMMTHNAITAMGRWYVAQRGRAVSVVTVGHQAGEAALPILYVGVVATVGWRNTWLMAASLLVLVALPVTYGLMRVERQPRSTDGVERRGAERNWTRSEVLRDPLFWLVLVGILAPGFIGTTIFFHQIYLVELRGWSVEAFAGSYVFMAMSTFCFALIGGVLIDRFSALALLPTFLAPLAGACLVLGLVDSQWGIFAFMALLGVSYGLSSTLFGAVWPEIYGTAHLGSIRAIVIALMVFSTAMGPGITGFLIDFDVSYPAQILVMGLYCVVVSFLMAMVGRKVMQRNSAGAATAEG
jgi:MFS family permease